MLLTHEPPSDSPQFADVGGIGIQEKVIRAWATWTDKGRSSRVKYIRNEEYPKGKA